MTVANIVSQIVAALTGALTGDNGLLKVIPSAIKEAFESLFLTTTGTGSEAVTSVSTFAVVMLCFGGIALAIGITKLVYHLIASKIGA